MQAFFKNHLEAALAAVAILLLAALAGYYFWGLTAVLTSIGEATELPEGGEGKNLFRLEEAKELLGEQDGIFTPEDGGQAKEETLEEGE